MLGAHGAGHSCPAGGCRRVEAQPWHCHLLLATRRLPPLRSLQPPMLVDPLDPGNSDPFEAAFAPWPLRFYILHRGRVAYKAQVGRPWQPWVHSAGNPQIVGPPLRAGLPAHHSRNNPLPPCPTALLQPRDCSYDMAELRERVLQLLEQEGPAQAAA